MVDKIGVVKAFGQPRGEYKSFTLKDFKDESTGKDIFISSKKDFAFEKGDKVKIDYIVMENGQYTNYYLSKAEVLEKATSVVNNSSFSGSSEFRINVDVSNSENRVVEFLNGCQDLSYKEKIELLRSGELSKLMIGNFYKSLESVEKQSEKKIETSVEQEDLDVPVVRPGQ